jgi:hypothetical protein
MSSNQDSNDIATGGRSDAPVTNNTAVAIPRPGGKGTGVTDLEALALRVLDESLRMAQQQAKILGPTIEARTWSPQSMAFPRRLIIYRGCTATRISGDAWTTSKVEALQYCLRGGELSPDAQVLVTAEIDVKDILSAYPHGSDAINLLVGRDPEIVRTQAVALQYEPSGKRRAVIGDGVPG